jgi:hypothetical protein
MIKDLDMEILNRIDNENILKIRSLSKKFRYNIYLIYMNRYLIYMNRYLIYMNRY